MFPTIYWIFYATTFGEFDCVRNIFSVNLSHILNLELPNVVSGILCGMLPSLCVNNHYILSVLPYLWCGERSWGRIGGVGRLNKAFAGWDRCGRRGWERNLPQTYFRFAHHGRWNQWRVTSAGKNVLSSHKIWNVKMGRKYFWINNKSIP